MGHSEYWEWNGGMQRSGSEGLGWNRRKTMKDRKGKQEGKEGSHEGETRKTNAQPKRSRISKRRVDD